MSNQNMKFLAEDIIDYCKTVESASIKLRVQIEKLLGSEFKGMIPEDRFSCLRWEDEKGSRLGDFQVAYQKHNLADRWQHAFNVLKANTSLIANPFHEEGYEYRYWIYPEKYLDRIFRKKLSEGKD